MADEDGIGVSAFSFASHKDAQGAVYTLPSSWRVRGTGDGCASMRALKLEIRSGRFCRPEWRYRNKKPITEVVRAVWPVRSARARS